MTEFNPIFRSPLVVATAPTQISETDLSVTDLTGIQITLIQGEIGAGLQKHFSEIPAEPGQLVELEAGFLARLTPHELYLFGKSSGADLPSTEVLQADLHTANPATFATDYTHGKAVLSLTGSLAAGVLSKICGLDFHPAVFSSMQVKQTSAAKIKTLIARCDQGDTPVYQLHVNRPFGQYFWDILWDAGQEFGIIVRGV